MLDNGSVVEQGTHETLMEKEGGKYQAMVRRQQLEKIDDEDDDDDDTINIQRLKEENDKEICMLIL